MKSKETHHTHVPVCASPLACCRDGRGSEEEGDGVAAAVDVAVAGGAQPQADGQPDPQPPSPPRLGQLHEVPLLRRPRPRAQAVGGVRLRRIHHHRHRHRRLPRLGVHARARPPVPRHHLLP